MKWRNHLDIADAVAEALGLPPYLREVLRQASVEPDKHGERLMQFDRKGEPSLRWTRHHRPEVEVIESLAWKGRRAFLEGRQDDAVWCVGKALHYLQDECVSTGLLGIKHDDREDAISDHRVSRDAVLSGVRGAEPSASFMRDVLRSIRPNRDPVKALDRAGLFSGALAASVLLEREPNRRILLEWQGARRRFRTVVLPASIMVAVVASMASFLLGEALIVLAVVPAFLAPIAYRRYWSTKEEMAWFGL